MSAALSITDTGQLTGQHRLNETEFMPFMMICFAAIQQQQQHSRNNSSVYLDKIVQLLWAEEKEKSGKQ